MRVLGSLRVERERERAAAAAADCRLIGDGSHRTHNLICRHHVCCCFVSLTHSPRVRMGACVPSVRRPLEDTHTLMS